MDRSKTAPQSRISFEEEEGEEVIELDAQTLIQLTDEEFRVVYGKFT